MGDENKTREQLISELAELRHRVREVEALDKSEEPYRHLFEQCPIGIGIASLDGRVVTANRTMESITGYSTEELKKINLADTYENVEDRKALLQAMSQYGSVVDFPVRLKRKDGTPYDALLSISRVNLGGKDFLHTICQDITKRKRAEEQLKTSLREKEELLSEVHHRVKNNLQVISSLLDMSSMRTKDQRAIGLLTDARAKIYTMALIHSQLYEGERFDQIKMASHIEELVSYLAGLYPEAQRISTVIEVPEIYLPITQALPCALVLNELISNAFKHAFKERQTGTVKISMQRSDKDMILMKVKDDGIGLPNEIDIHKTDTLGLKLVRNLVEKQLNGKIQVKRDEGTEFIIEFKILERAEYG